MLGEMDVGKGGEGNNVGGNGAGERCWDSDVEEIDAGGKEVREITWREMVLESVMLGEVMLGNVRLQ